jgi:hypothetical protein
MFDAVASKVKVLNSNHRSLGLPFDLVGILRARSFKEQHEKSLTPIQDEFQDRLFLASMKP